MSETISVIIPTYQHGKSILTCLNSVFSQSRIPDEVIVVDDGSTDTTKEVVKSLAKNVTYFYQDNQGAAAARMTGFEKSSGSLVLFCDADVMMQPNMLELLENALKNDSEASWAYSGFNWGWKSFKSRAFDFERLKQDNFIHTTALIRRDAFVGFDTSLKRFQDWDLWLSMAEEGHKGAYVPSNLFRVNHQFGRSGMSAWVPSFFFKLPWKIKRVRDYEEAKNVIKQKHSL